MRDEFEDDPDDGEPKGQFIFFPIGETRICGSCVDQDGHHINDEADRKGGCKIPQKPIYPRMGLDMIGIVCLVIDGQSQ